ncbi:hypothetical protein D3C77_163820 [compost metagenome]
MPKGAEHALVQLLKRTQAALNLPQPLVEHIFANPHRQARATEQPGNHTLVADHEVGLVLIKRHQRLADLSGSGHQLGFLTRTGRTVVRIANNEDFARLETLGKGWVESLQTG